MKVRKTLEAWPLRLRLGAEYDLRANEVAATAECRDTILGGEFTLETSTHNDARTLKAKTHTHHLQTKEMEASCVRGPQ